MHDVQAPKQGHETPHHADSSCQTHLCSSLNHRLPKMIFPKSCSMNSKQGSTLFLYLLTVHAQGRHVTPPKSQSSPANSAVNTMQVPPPVSNLQIRIQKSPQKFHAQSSSANSTEGLHAVHLPAEGKTLGKCVELHDQGRGTHEGWPRPFSIFSRLGALQRELEGEFLLQLLPQRPGTP